MIEAGVIPVLLNPKAGSAARARALLERDSRFELREMAPESIADAVRAEARRNTRRLVVCGGDGTLSAALGAAVGSALEIGVLPGGTLNHFARDYGIPLDDPAAAFDVALRGTARPVELGFVNGHPILNTSSVGVYVDFVRRRELLEHWFRYRVASVAAAFDVWRNPRALAVDVHTDAGAHRRLHTPLVFVGVHERVLDRGALGTRRRDGARALHVLLVNEHRRPRIHALAFRAVVRGIDGLIAADEVESHLTTGAVVTGSDETNTIAIDGELVRVSSPLRYELVPNAVMVVCP